ncbi:MAG: hypothetical protein LEGION0403_FIIPPAGN_00129 [Legionella sp.]|uniref:outer membrane protein n=1 Tax=Legionella sp. TaxID=459 RepID=UPI003D0F4B88
MRWNFFGRSIASLAFVFSSPTFSQDTEKNVEPFWSSTGNWVVSFGAGVQYPQWNDLMRINNTPNSLTPRSNNLFSTRNQSEPVIGLALGRSWQHDSVWFPAYSFSAVWKYFFRTNIGNRILNNSGPELANYKYDWDLTANMLLASAKVNLFQYKKFSPFAHAGIGSSFNRTSRYKERAPAGVTPRVSPQFSNFSTSEFTYNVGAGLDLLLTPQWTLSVGYSYQDLGQISSGPGKGTWSNQSLNPGSYHSNEVLVSVSYIFGGNQTAQVVK